jgi:phospholipase/carboxylesterase
VVVVHARLDGLGRRIRTNDVVVTMRLASLASSATLVALSACGGSADEAATEREPTTETQARITAPQAGAEGRCRPGKHSLRVGAGREAVMRVTAGTRGGGKALILALHGANSGGAGGGLYAFRGAWKVPGVVMVAPASKGSTWSYLSGSDVDLPVVQRALTQAFARCPINPRLVAVGGFSDGASYALTLGLTNGDRFRAIIALSPGGAVAPDRVGKPRVFVAHGTADPVLPIERTSDRIVRSLRNDGYTVTYRRFKGVHEVRPEIAGAAVRWFLRN